MRHGGVEGKRHNSDWKKKYTDPLLASFTALGIINWSLGAVPSPHFGGQTLQSISSSDHSSTENPLVVFDRFSL